MPARPALRSLLPGTLLAAALALPAWALGQVLPLLGGAVLAIVFGVALRAAWTPPPAFGPGIAFTGKRVLQASIVLLGFGLDLGEVARVGRESLQVTMVTLLLAFATAWALGRVLRVPARLATLVGVGTAICGASAIAAVTPILRPEKHEVAFAISTIFLFNVIAVLLFPLLGHLLNLSDLGFGLWAGTAINDTSSVVAAGYSYSHAAGDYATIVKLTRATLIIPICLVLAFVVAAREKRQHAQAGGAGGFSLARIFPWFILWFVVASGVRTLGLVPVAIQPALHMLAEFMIIVALTAIGLSANLRKMVSSGARPILLGLGVWIAVAVSSLLVQLLIGRL